MDSCSLNGPVCVAPCHRGLYHHKAMNVQSAQEVEDGAALEGEWTGYDTWTGFAPVA